VVALKWAVREMEERYRKMSKLGVRNIDGYNARVTEAKSKNEPMFRTVHTGYDKESGEAIYEKRISSSTPSRISWSCRRDGRPDDGCRQGHRGRDPAPGADGARGRHPRRAGNAASFGRRHHRHHQGELSDPHLVPVTSKIDSRTILGEMGAEQLLGQGDMLYMAGGGRISRVHGPFLLRRGSREDRPPHQDARRPAIPRKPSSSRPSRRRTARTARCSTSPRWGQTNDLYSQAVAIVMRDRKASTSYIQRRLQIGYNRAASLMEKMELEGIVGAANHSGKREILVGETEHATY